MTRRLAYTEYRTLPRADLLSVAYRLPAIARAMQAAEMTHPMRSNTPGAGFLTKIYANAQMCVVLKVGFMVRQQIAPSSRQTA